MIRYIPCETARERLEAFVDGELSTADQVAVQTHLRACRTCAAHVEDLSLIAWSVRAGAPPGHAAADARTLAVIQSGVLTRIRAERAQCLRARLAEMFSDMRLLWPALGATTAVVMGLLLAGTIWRVTVADRAPGSLAARVDGAYGAPGSDNNPVRLHHWVSVPRVLDEEFALDGVPADDAEFAFWAVVTQKGRVDWAEVIDGTEPASRPGEVQDVLHAFRASRFVPAHAPSGNPVAVMAVFYFTQTTVKQQSSSQLDVWPAFRPAPPRPPADPQQSSLPSGRRSSLQTRSATA